nr:MAG TPA: hypothetical protein [Bacteriophage sp.]
MSLTLYKLNNRFDGFTLKPYEDGLNYTLK